MQIHVLLSLFQRKGVLLPPLGWQKQFLVHIHVEPVALGIRLGGCAEGQFIPDGRGPGKFGSWAAVAKAEPCCAVSCSCMGRQWCLGD